ncbi:RagB/SusD family nutrient uptake outer membrane protein [Compostibacter hankyongensis]|uniref:RagB/SusD family nutrient uptake outer membrane protein n=1 Tax=Compostibacter hankyongensis TaxID=1007089 RepID=A0ABP8FG44_9BACT
MKPKIYLLLIAFWGLVSACKKNLDIPPMNVVGDDDIFSDISGIDSYMARIYSELPIEDFKWSPNNGFNAYYYGSPASVTGEAISRDPQSATENIDAFWGNAYRLIRECNYFMETLPSYAGNFSDAQVKNWSAEARFVRGMTYFALVKRFGGVPLVDSVLTRPGESITDITQNIEELKIPRASEEVVYDFIARDLDSAYANLPETNQAGRANRYAAAAFKSRAMLFAGSIAKYNSVSLVSGSARLCGIPAEKAVSYFKASYDAAGLLDGKYSLYMKSWAEGDKDAQYTNFVNLFTDASSPENIFIRRYKYPDAAHWYDVNNVPRQISPNVSSETCPTLDFVEMFEGLPKNPDGTLMTVGADGKYILYNNTMDLFANAEPRLRATVIFPGDAFSGQNIEVRRGIYTGSAAGGIGKLIPFGSTNAYPTADLLSSASDVQTPYTLPDGTKMNPAGLSGVFTNYNGTAGCISGFLVRKYLVPNKPASEMQNNHSEQSWIEMRYAEVLLNRAEAAYELASAGQSGPYMADALSIINRIRKRAGASELTALSGIDDIWTERRKELAFENKTWWDMKRWRISDKEQNGTIYRVLMPFYSSEAGQYFFDPRFDERNTRYTFDPRWYYAKIPDAAIAKSANLVQNPGY